MTVRIIVSEDALADIEASDGWWRINRPDSPDLVRSEVAAALEALPNVAGSLPVFRRIRAGNVRRHHVARIHRHLYLLVDDDRIVVLAVWGAVRGILPGLRSRASRAQL